MSFHDCQKTILVQFAHVFLHVFQKIILVRYVHEFLSCLPKDYTCAMCSRVFKVIKEYEELRYVAVVVLFEIFHLKISLPTLPWIFQVTFR